MKISIQILGFVVLSILISCNQTGNRPNSMKQISDYTKSTESFKMIVHI